MWTRVLLVLLGAVVPVQVQELPNTGVNGFSLHPPYFNLAEGTKITATATCGEDESGRTQHDLYCKLVGGPVSGDPSQTIQVSNTRATPGHAGSDWTGLVHLYQTLTQVNVMMIWSKSGTGLVL